MFNHHISNNITNIFGVQFFYTHFFYKGHVIRDTSQISEKNKGQRLVISEKLRDSL